MARYDIKNCSSGVRKFWAGGRYLEMAGGEIERDVEMSKDEHDAIKDNREFKLTEVGGKPEAKTVEIKKPAPKADE